MARLAAQTVGTAIGRVVAAVEGIAFWTAVTLPALYGPALALYAAEALSGTALAGLVGTHVLALVVGHRYNRSTALPGVRNRLRLRSRLRRPARV